MLRHNLLLIFRNFKRFKSTFFINLIGLSSGLACALLIYLWVNDELSVDKFHEKDDRLFQVMENQQHASDIGTTNSTPWLLAETLAEEMPEVEHAVVVAPTFWFGQLTLSVNNNSVKAAGHYTSKYFFNVFSYKLLEGNRDRVLQDKKSIVISKNLAKKLFSSTTDVLGKVVEFQHSEQFTVSGVFQNVPTNSSDQFDFVLSYELLKDKSPQITNWQNSGPNTMLVLKKGVLAEEFTKKITGLIKTKSEDKHRTLFLQRYSDNYLYGNYENGVQSGGRIEYVTLFSIIALFILIIACINFMNLSTAKASRRIKEVGIKKAIGAGRRALILQYLGESMFMSFLSLGVAILLVDLFLPQFNTITGKQLDLSFNLNFILSIFGIVLFTGIISGSYPAFYLSGFNPSAVLKGKLNSSLGEMWARKGLVIFQFTMSVILIVCVVIIYKQIEYVQNKNIGYNKDNVIQFDIEGKVVGSLETFINEAKKIPGMVNVSSVASRLIGGGNTTDIEWEGKNPDDHIPVAIRPVNYDVIELLGMEIKAGRSFSRQHGTDSTKVIFNEAAIQVMGMKDPVGKPIKLGPMNLEIIGVMKNFNFESLHSNVRPMFLILMPQYTEKIIAKIEAGKERETIERLQTFYKEFNPGFVLDYRFLDEEYQAQYAAEGRVAMLSRYFAGLAIIISSLGLLGLAAFTAERRLKEIGIRKVLGSTEFGVVYLLSSDFTKIVLAAIVIALPVSYWLAKFWLSNFAYKIDLSFWYFFLSGFIALLIAWLTVGSQAWRAARVNPTKCLRDE